MLNGKICLVTGASRGIGRSIVEVFARNQGIVYANIRTEGWLNDWLSTLSEDVRSRIFPVVFDVCDADKVKKTILIAKKKHGHIDVWVNNAAVAYNEAIGMISHAHVQKMLDTNVASVIENLQLISRIMIRQRAGSIINIASIVGVEGDAGQLAYSSTKGAVISITKSAAKELAPYQIRVNSVAPGLTNTDLLKNTAAHYLDKRISNIGMGRLAEPEDIANACLFFASDLSSYVTGQVLKVDGASLL